MAKAWIAALISRGVICLGIQSERGALPGNGGKLFLVHINRDNDAAQRGRDLGGIAADAANAVDDDEVSFRDTGLHDRLVGRGHRIGDHGKIGQFNSGRRQAVLIDDTQSARRHDDMRGEAAMNIVARHLLVRADRRLAAQAGIALAARDDRRNNNRPVGVPKSIRAGVDDMATDLMPERERQFMLGAHAIVIIAKIGMADPAAGDFDQDFIGARGTDFEFHRDKRLACARHHPTNWFGAHGPALQLGREPDRRTWHAALFFILCSPTVGLP